MQYVPQIFMPYSFTVFHWKSERIWHSSEIVVVIFWPLIKDILNRLDTPHLCTTWLPYVSFFVYCNVPRHVNRCFWVKSTQIQVEPGWWWRSWKPTPTPRSRTTSCSRGIRTGQWMRVCFSFFILARAHLWPTRRVSSFHLGGHVQWVWVKNTRMTSP